MIQLSHRRHKSWPMNGTQQISLVLEVGMVFIPLCTGFRHDWHILTCILQYLWCDVLLKGKAALEHLLMKSVAGVHFRSRRFLQI